VVTKEDDTNFIWQDTMLFTVNKVMKNYCQYCVFTLLVILLAISPVVIAGELYFEQSREIVSKRVKERLQIRITRTWVDLPIEEVLMDLAEEARVDIIKSPSVVGNVTAKVTDVPLEEVLTNILAAHNYTYIATNNMIRVVPISEIALVREELVSKVYRITYADANEVATALTNFISERGRVAVNKGTSHIVVTDTAEKIKAIDEFISQLDAVTPQVLVEVRVYDITTKEGFEIGTSWNVGRNAPLITKTTPLTETITTVTGPTKTESSETTPDKTTTGWGTSSETTPDRSTTGWGTSSETKPDKTTTGWGTSSETTPDKTTTGWTESSETITGNYGDSDDPAGGMTTIGRADSSETTFGGTTTGRTDSSEITLGGTTTGRTDSSETTLGGTTTGRTDSSETILGGTTTRQTTTDESANTETRVTRLPTTTYSRKPFVGGSYDRIRGGSLRFSLLNKVVDIDFVLEMLHTQLEAKLLANPRILVLDNETANFEIVREIPYRELRQVAREDPMTYTEFKDVGVRLKVTPHITRDDMLRLHIAPEFSILVSQDSNGVPTVDARRADTVALVKDGQTIAIGGLRKRQISKGITKVPVLGDIPLVGGLFKSKTELKEINELVVFITPRIITNPELLATNLTDSESIEIPKEPDYVDKPRREYKRKIRSYTRKPRIDEKRLNDMILRAFAYIKADRCGIAKNILKSVIQIHPNSSTAYRYLGYCHIKLGEMDDSIVSYSKAIEINAGDWEAQRGLGIAYMLIAIRNNSETLKEKALQRWRQSLRLKPDQPKRNQLLKLIQTYSR